MKSKSVEQVIVWDPIKGGMIAESSHGRGTTFVPNPVKPKPAKPPAKKKKTPAKPKPKPKKKAS
ncbi:MAG TPA: hypothetical protein VIH61_02680 [Waddliaceae bacterium]